MPGPSPLRLDHFTELVLKPQPRELPMMDGENAETVAVLLAIVLMTRWRMIVMIAICHSVSMLSVQQYA